MDYRGMEAVISRRAARQVQTTPNKQERFQQRGEAIRAARALGLPYKVTPLSVIVGRAPTRPQVIPEAMPAKPKQPMSRKRKTIWSRPEVFKRVQRTSRADID